MKRFRRFGSLMAAIMLTGIALATELETDAQKLAYIIGMDIGASLKQQGTELDLEVLYFALKASYKGEELAMTPEEAATLQQSFVAKQREEAARERELLAATNAAEGDRFLLKNRLKEDMKITDSGLQYEVITMGDGPKPAATDKVKVHYRGTFLDGKEFDSSYARGEPISFQLDQVIAGWTEGVQLMPVGSKFMFYIPSNLAYGPDGGRTIGPNASLIFQVELLGIE